MASLEIAAGKIQRLGAWLLCLRFWLFIYARQGPKPRARRTHENAIVVAVAVAPAAAGWSNKKQIRNKDSMCFFLGNGFQGFG